MLSHDQLWGGAIVAGLPAGHGAVEHEGAGQQRAEKGDQAGFAQDIRLTSNGLDVNDNDFVVGLVGPDLYPLFHLVQSMRKTIQTSEHIEKLGPFFIGRACWQSVARELHPLTGNRLEEAMRGRFRKVPRYRPEERVSGLGALLLPWSPSLPFTRDPFLWANRGSRTLTAATSPERSAAIICCPPMPSSWPASIPAHGIIG